MLCLVALGRTWKLIRSSRPSSPTIRCISLPRTCRLAFARPLALSVGVSSPPFARGLYAEGKAAFDCKSYAEAVEKLDRAVQLIDVIDKADQHELADFARWRQDFSIWAA